MIQSRRFVPQDRYIEMKHDPSAFKKFVPKKIRADKTNKLTSRFGMVKPSVIKKKPAVRISSRNLFKNDSNWKIKAKKLRDIPPTSEDFIAKSMLLTEKYGEQVRISKINIDKQNMQDLLNTPISIPDRDAQGNIQRDVNGKVKMKEVKISAMLKTPQLQFEMLNVLNNTQQQLGKYMPVLLQILMMNNFDKLSDQEKQESYDKIKKLKKGKKVANLANTPFVVDTGNISSQTLGDLYSHYKDRGLADDRIHQNMRFPYLFYPDYDRESGDFRSIINRQLTGNVYGTNIMLAKHYVVMMNILTGIATKYIKGVSNVREGRKFIVDMASVIQRTIDAIKSEGIQGMDPTVTAKVVQRAIYDEASRFLQTRTTLAKDIIDGLVTRSIFGARGAPPRAKAKQAEVKQEEFEEEEEEEDEPEPEQFRERKQNLEEGSGVFAGIRVSVDENRAITGFDIGIPGNPQMIDDQYYDSIARGGKERFLKALYGICRDRRTNTKSHATFDNVVSWRAMRNKIKHDDPGRQWYVLINDRDDFQWQSAV